MTSPSFPSFPDPDVERSRSRWAAEQRAARLAAGIPEPSTDPTAGWPTPLRLLFNGVAGFIGVLWGLFFMTFGLLGVFVVAGIFG